MLQVRAVRILKESADVAIRVPQVLGESIGRQEVKSIGETLIQRSLKRVIEHFKLSVIQRQDLRHIGLLDKVSPPKIRLAVRGIAAEICVQRLNRLVEIA